MLVPKALTSDWWCMFKLESSSFDLRVLLNSWKRDPKFILQLSQCDHKNSLLQDILRSFLTNTIPRVCGSLTHHVISHSAKQLRTCFPQTAQVSTFPLVGNVSPLLWKPSLVPLAGGAWILSLFFLLLRHSSFNKWFSPALLFSNSIPQNHGMVWLEGTLCQLPAGDTFH